MMLRPVVSKEKRLANLNTALLTFGKFYKVDDDVLRQLGDKLIIVPQDIELQENRLFFGRPARPSDLVVAEYKDWLINALKAIDWWKNYDPSGRDLLRKRLTRAGKLATTHGNVANRRKGRPKYQYTDLEKSYAIAIADTLNNKFPISRSPEGKLYGHAFALLEAALDYALPHTGINGREGRAMRIRAIFRNNLDSDI
jgi:hypothetical protein